MLQAFLLWLDTTALPWLKAHWLEVGLALAVLGASFFANEYRKESLVERKATETAKLDLEKQTEAISGVKEKLLWTESRLTEKEMLLKQSQRGSRTETIGADGSKTTREEWDNQMEEFSKQVQFYSMELESAKAEINQLRQDLSISQGWASSLSEKISLVEVKKPSFRAWGVLAGRHGGGVGYHVNLGFLDIGAYAKNASYTEFAPSWELNARF